MIVILKYLAAQNKDLLFRIHYVGVNIKKFFW